ncbi:MAG: DUF6067 family protein [Clostridia bacterium]|nr:DUF6067 family protein [Clostridia bacterium]
MKQQYKPYNGLPHPFTPVYAKNVEGKQTIDVWNRQYIFGVDSMPISIKTGGKEVLAAPIRLVGSEAGKPIVWEQDYEKNESTVFVQKREDDGVQLVGALQCENFIVNTAFTIAFDGCVTVDLKLMPRGLTVAEAFYEIKRKARNYKIENLFLEIPIRKEYASLYNMFPNSEFRFFDGTETKENRTSASGRTPEKDAFLPFKPLFWLGNEEVGLSFFAESDYGMEIENPSRVIELIHTEEAVVLRIHLLDRQPYSWQPVEGDEDIGCRAFPPIGFRFGFMATPVRPFPKNPYVHNAFQLDCFVKTPNDYYRYLSGACIEGSDETGFDRLKRLGVTTLILHEKWNPCQNWFTLSEETGNMLRKIVEECHSRGIKVLTYFGYEIASNIPEFLDIRDSVLMRRKNGRTGGGWYRVPYQRDYWVCYNSEYQDIFVQGVGHIMDKYHIDGIYLDGTSSITEMCYNTEHGCGWYDDAGNLHGTYPISAIRTMFQKLYNVVEARGGMINLHSACRNIPVMPYIHQLWSGETLQIDYRQGKMTEIPLDYFRTEYTGRNMGIPTEFIAYENRPVWTFENALACSLIHGILPRPNDIAEPLELMSKVWEIFNTFPITLSDWLPYWNNDKLLHISDERVKGSMYRYTSPDGKRMYLVLLANITKDSIEDVTITVNDDVSEASQMTGNINRVPVKNGTVTATVAGYCYKIYLFR